MNDWVNERKVGTRETDLSCSLNKADNVFGCAMEFLDILSRYDDDPAIESWDLKNRVLQYILVERPESQISNLFVSVSENFVRAPKQANCADETQKGDL